MRLAWITDPHFDHAGHGKTIDLASKTAGVSDACVITGDIGTARTVIRLLEVFQRNYRKPVCFVLGNHDFYGGEFASVARSVRKAFGCSYLDSGAVFHLTPDADLCGVDGWYDARFGSPETSSVQLNDWSEIQDLRECVQSGTLIPALRMIGDHFHQKTLETLSRTTAKRIIFATHVPPFAESSVYNGKQSDANWLPWFTNKALGDALLEWARKNQDREIEVLCGHTHGRATFQPSPNLTVRTGFAEYGAPCVEMVLDLAKEKACSKT
jgi:Icc-related predicted phosphoesterase